MTLYDSSAVDTNAPHRVIKWDAGDSIFMEGGLEAAQFAAALRGDTFNIWHHHDDNIWTTDHIIAMAPVDDTDANSYRALATNEVAVISMVYLQLETVSDEIHLEMGYFSDATPGVSSDYATAGFTNMMGFDLAAVSAAASSGANLMQPVELKPPLVVGYSGTAGCIGFRAKVNDSNVDACIGARGFVMKDPALHTST